MLSAVYTLILLDASSAVRSAPKAKSQTLLSVHRQPDTDHLVKELYDNADYKDPAKKPMTSLAKDFAQMDLNGDASLEMEELMFHQFATGCEPIEAQVRAQDYMRCG